MPQRTRGRTDVVRRTDLAAWLFFFQAEDGIRDYKVTGVQTCALPICVRQAPPHRDQSLRGAALQMLAGGAAVALLGGRKSGGEGKRVDLGGGRIIKKKKTQTTTNPTEEPP